jgi:hypothetical protein
LGEVVDQHQEGEGDQPRGVEVVVEDHQERVVEAEVVGHHRRGVEEVEGDLPLQEKVGVEEEVDRRLQGVGVVVEGLQGLQMQHSGLLLYLTVSTKTNEFRI